MVIFIITLFDIDGSVGCGSFESRAHLATVRQFQRNSSLKLIQRFAQMPRNRKFRQTGWRRMRTQFKIPLTSIALLSLLLVLVASCRIHFS